MKTVLSHFKILPIYGTYLIMFAQASISKFANFGIVPDWFQKQFVDTMLNPFAGALRLEFYGIAFLELTVAVLLLASLFRGELAAGRQKPLLRLSLLLSGFVFCILSFGLRITGDFATASQVFIYCAASFALFEYLKLTEGHLET